jgi:hypothetical protein
MVNKCWRVNSTNDEENAANKQKRQAFMGNWQLVIKAGDANATFVTRPLLMK